MLEKLKSLTGKFRYDDSEMPFLEHLEEFRRMIIRVFASLAVGMLIVLPFADHLIGVLRAPAEPYIIKNAEEVLSEAAVQLRIPVDALSTNTLYTAEDGTRYYDVKAEVALNEGQQVHTGGIRLQFSEPAAAIKMWLTVTFFGGLLLSLPFVVFFVGLFVMPGIRDVERKMMSRISMFSGGLFLAGIYMGYKVTLPLALGLMLKIGGQLGGESIWFYNKYIGFALQLLLAFGVAFQMPVVILILGKMGLVSSSSLRAGRPYVIVGIFVLAMILTPPDVVTQILMAAPLIFLYEFCVWFLYFSGNRDLPPREEETEESVDAEPETGSHVAEETPVDEPDDDENQPKKDLSKE
ncbi:twin-arginine translocase subunit TatC [Pontiella agarivorans]|uniref:Sec-independent protein translocase protein TatC n=1 Tax=Pontiella agarivorans TaxID=3038953 RepID=A0ABU5MSK3_9BACT|nr:twin-arginine translocase subunit TatC [Pontiella agarivorans]MDZ8117174.1 twin-arginine translocase subunit TatC [Pontiella agarivorans]